MLLIKWNKHLSTNDKTLYNYYEEFFYKNTSNFFSPLNIIDNFKNNDNYFNLPEIQILFENFNKNTLNALNSTILNIELNKLFEISYFSNINFLNKNYNFEFINLNKKLITDLVEISNYKNNVIELIEVFPDYELELEVFDFTALEAEQNIYEILSTPDFKLYYPEPYIASPSFNHEDLWYVHILHYQHWIWFFFISLILFFFITFLNTVRWCNLRNKPKRETRGVSRSKCADLITGSVPVSWAISIIISETVDASDYYDGFTTGEIVIGIRAYQWGWEYFYPKNIDLNYNVKPTYSLLIGNSIKYNTSSEINNNSNTLWKFYQNKKYNNQSSTPSHLLLNVNDNSKLLNFMNFNNFGINNLDASTSFKKIQYFSKTNIQNLYNIKSDYNFLFNKINSLYNNDYILQNSYSYGIYRQHNYNSLLSNLNNNTSLLDSKSLVKLLNYSTKISFNKNNSIDYYTNSAILFKKDLNNELSLRLNSFYKLSFNFYNSLNYILKSKNINDTNVNNVNQILLINNKFKNNFFLQNKYINNSTNNNDLFSLNLQTNKNYKYINNFFSNKQIDLKSSNLQFLNNERSLRLFNQSNTKKLNFNLNSLDINNSFLNNINTSNINNLFSVNNRFLNSRLPVTNNNLIDYDKTFKREFEGSPLLFKSKEELAPNYIFSNYWLNNWSTPLYEKRLNTLLSNNNIFFNFYIPIHIDYSEYDFKNWQSLEILEDIFWESTYSSYTHDEYYNILQGSKDISFFDKQEDIFNNSNRYLKQKKMKSGLLNKPFFKDNLYKTNLRSLPIFSDEGIVDSTLLNLNNFKTFTSELNFDLLEDNLDNLKYLNYIYYLNYKNKLNINNNNIQPVSYVYIMDMFRSDFEENNFYLDNFNTNNLIKIFNKNNFSLNNDLRTSNLLKLRSTTKNAIVTYNAIQKVFKPRFDEGRSNSRLEDLTNSYNSHMFLTDSRPKFEFFLGKNKESFFLPLFYNTNLKLNFSLLNTISNSLNIYFLNIPFMLSLKSDPSRYLWFDWESLWSIIDIQYSSASRYSLSGLPHTTKNFDYSSNQVDEINDSETYLNKLTCARKNYLSNWAFTPYLYLRNSNWYKNSNVVNLLFTIDNLFFLKFLLKYSNFFWENTKLFSLNLNKSTISYSMVNTPGRSSWKPISTLPNLLYNKTILVDILSKRELLYREFFYNKGFNILLPKYLISTPNNPLLLEVERNYNLIDPIIFNSELSREVFYQSTNFIKFIILKDFLLISNNLFTNSFLNLTFLNNYLYFYLFNNYNNYTIDNNYELFKDQYRPMKKGITNMVRLHATGAIAMPIEVRLHMLASSKDVIHSWAVPSAGIKIDCVPGFSSHRIMIFLISGIFWGQCMEICGRFHHWMPIIVYFMKRDLFFLWCTHFIHYSTLDNVFDMTDKQLIDYIQFVSYDKTSWVSELNKII